MIIGFVGFIGSGKDTAAEYLVEKYKFRRDSFAAPLKDAVADIFDWDRQLLEGHTNESRAWRECADPWWSERLGREVTPRNTLQIWGTEVGRNAYHTDIWVASLENRLRKTTDDIVITDCRFPNEIDVIKKAGGVIVRIRRGRDPDWIQDALDYLSFPAGKPPSHIPHQSEWAWLDRHYDVLVSNNGPVKWLHERLDSMMAMLALTDAAV
jgi:hypothetical protein